MTTPYVNIYSLLRLLYVPYHIQHRLLVFVVILALSNLGTSFASAILAKDSTTNDKNELVSTKTGDTIATEEAVARFEAKEGPIKTSTRYLGVSGETATYTASSSDFTTIETTKAHELLKWCYKKNKDVIVAVNWANGDVTPRTVCSHTWSCNTSVFRDISGSQPTSATLCLENSDQVLWIQPVPGNPDLYTISETELSSYVDVCSILAVHAEGEDGMPDETRFGKFRMNKQEYRSYIHLI